MFVVNGLCVRRAWAVVVVSDSVLPPTTTRTHTQKKRTPTLNSCARIWICWMRAGRSSASTSSCGNLQNLSFFLGGGGRERGVERATTRAHSGGACRRPACPPVAARFRGKPARLTPGRLPSARLGAVVEQLARGVVGVLSWVCCVFARQANGEWFARTHNARHTRTQRTSPEHDCTVNRSFCGPSGGPRMVAESA